MGCEIRVMAEMDVVVVVIVVVWEATPSQSARHHRNLP